MLKPNPKATIDFQNRVAQLAHKEKSVVTDWQTDDFHESIAEFSFRVDGATAPIQDVNLNGFGIYFRRQGSVPGTLYDVLLSWKGRQVTIPNFGPGQYIRQRFDRARFTIVRRNSSSGSIHTVKAYANIVVLRSNEAVYSEPLNDVAPNQFLPVSSEWNSGKAGQLITTYSDPTTTIADIDCRGWKRLLILVQGSPIAAATDYDVTPYINGIPPYYMLTEKFVATSDAAGDTLGFGYETSGMQFLSFLFGTSLGGSGITADVLGVG
jgi:hypothetical protein